MERLFEDFATGLSPHWCRHLKGAGSLETLSGRLRLVNRDTRAHIYTNAQIDDYQGLSLRDLAWRPPVTLRVRARFSHPAGRLSGTAGFGFWNDPFFMTGRRLPALPQAIWFFYASAASNMKLDLNTPGHGWKASTIDAASWQFLLLLPSAPLAVLLMNFRYLYRMLWPIGQRAIGVSEAPVKGSMTDWHVYTIEWAVKQARFLVDAVPVLECNTSPSGPLGFVMWLDNQYAVVTPWGRFRFGLLAQPGTQWIEVDRLSIQSGQV